MEGQMWPAERDFLANAIKERNPSIILEVGTWKGGGSTLQIANAMAESSTLITCEVDKNFYDQAMRDLSDHKNFDNIKFNNVPSYELIDDIIENGVIPEFVFFDGPEDPEINYNDFKRLEEYVKPGTYFCMHDWDLGVRADGLTSTKAEYVRPYVEKSDKWDILRTLTSPVSVGIVLAKKL